MTQWVKVFVRDSRGRETHTLLYRTCTCLYTHRRSNNNLKHGARPCKWLKVNEGTQCSFQDYIIHTEVKPDWELL